MNIFSAVLIVLATRLPAIDPNVRADVADAITIRRANATAQKPTSARRVSTKGTALPLGLAIACDCWTATVRHQTFIPPSTTRSMPVT